MPHSHNTAPADIFAGANSEHTPSTPQAAAAQHPDQCQGWYVVAGLALTLCILFGTTLNSFGVFILPITNSFQSSNEQTANIATAFMVTMTLTMPVAGWLLDRIGSRIVMASGAALMGAGYLLASVSQSLNTLTLALALAGIGIGASTYVPAIAVVMRWIELKRQGLALGVLLAGGSIGTILFPIMLTHFTEAYGWRNAMQLIAALALLICVPLMLWLARLPEKVAVAEGAPAHTLAGATIAHAMKMPRYWLWVSLQVLLTLSTLGIVVNIIPYLVSVGYSPQEAATFFAFKSVAGLTGTFVFGVLSSRWGIKPLLMIGTTIGATGILSLLLAPDAAFGFAAVVFFTVAWGATFNLVNQLSPVLMEQTVGARNFATLLGIGSLIAGIGSAFSPKLIGYLLDNAGSYAPALILCAGCALAALVPIALQPKADPKSNTG